MYFGNYRKLVYLAQAPKPGSEEQARAIAARMGLEFEIRQTGYGTLGTTLVNAVTRRDARRGDGVRGDAETGDEARRGEEVVAWVR
jgi:hypothetical protein